MVRLSSAHSQTISSGILCLAIFLGKMLVSWPLKTKRMDSLLLSKWDQLKEKLKTFLQARFARMELKYALSRVTIWALSIFMGFVTGTWGMKNRCPSTSDQCGLLKIACNQTPPYVRTGYIYVSLITMQDRTPKKILKSYRGKIVNSEKHAKREELMEGLNTY